jgi:hypothetical protein
MFILLYFLLFYFPSCIISLYLILSRCLHVLITCVYVYLHKHTYAIRKCEIYVRQQVYLLLNPMFSSFLYFFISGFICLSRLFISFFLVLVLIISLLPLLLKLMFVPTLCSTCSRMLGRCCFIQLPGT